MTAPHPSPRTRSILALARAGHTAPEIARQVGGVTVWSVQKLCHRHGVRLTRGRPKAVPPDLTPAQLARRRARQAIQNAKRRIGRPDPDLVPMRAPRLPATVRRRCCDRLVIGAVACPGCGAAPAWAREVAA